MAEENANIRLPYFRFHQFIAWLSKLKLRYYLTCFKL